MAAKHPNWSPYVSMNDNPILFVDPDGRENIVAIGGADIGQNDRYKFVNSGLGQAFSYGAAERTTIVLMTANLTNDEIAQVRQSVDAGNAYLYGGKEVVSLITVGSADELANYINSKSATDGSISQDRLADKVTDLAVFGHGVPGSMSFGYDYQLTTSSVEQQMSFGSAQIGKLDPQAFDNTKICLYTCNSATDTNGVNVARDLSKQTNTTVSGYLGYSSYKGIYSLWDRALKKAGYQILPSGNSPGAGEGATQKIYKNGTEQ